MKEMIDLFEKAKVLVASLAGKVEAAEQKEAQLKTRENAIAAKEAEFSGREKRVLDFEAVEKMHEESRKAVREARDITKMNCELQAKAMDEIAEQRKFLNQDITRLEEARANLAADKQEIKDNLARFEEEKKAYKDKIMKEIQKQFA